MSNASRPSEAVKSVLHPIFDGPRHLPPALGPKRCVVLKILS
jgi:hypothetical protein